MVFQFCWIWSIFIQDKVVVISKLELHQLYLGLSARLERSALNLNISTQGQLEHGHASSRLLDVSQRSHIRHRSCSTYRLGSLGKELVIRLIDKSKVGHLGDENVHLDNVLKAAASLLKHGLDVLESLSLPKQSVPSFQTQIFRSPFGP